MLMVISIVVTDVACLLYCIVSVYAVWHCGHVCRYCYGIIPVTLVTYWCAPISDLIVTSLAVLCGFSFPRGKASSMFRNLHFLNAVSVVHATLEQCCLAVWVPEAPIC